MIDQEQLDFDEAVEIADETFSVEIESENAKKHKTIYKKGGHNRTNGKRHTK